MKHVVRRYEDRISVSFGDDDKEDHDVIVSVTFDMRVVRDLNDDEIVKKALLQIEQCAGTR
jgi:hypothetical protein